MNKELEIWFITGSQDLYGAETLARVVADAKEVSAALNADAVIPAEVVWKPTVHNRPTDS